MRFVQTILLAVIAVATLVPGVQAQGESKPINLALWDPIQIFKNDVAIHGVRLNVYGVNSELKGVDIGIANWITGNTTVSSGVS